MIFTTTTNCFLSFSEAYLPPVCLRCIHTQVFAVCDNHYPVCPTHVQHCKPLWFVMYLKGVKIVCVKRETWTLWLPLQRNPMHKRRSMHFDITSLHCGHRMEQLSAVVLWLSCVAISLNMAVPVFNDDCKHFLLSDMEGELMQTESVLLNN